MVKCGNTTGRKIPFHIILKGSREEILDDSLRLSVTVLHLLSPLTPYHLVSHLLSYT